MAKRGMKSKQIKRNIHYHIRHKTKITFFLIFKVLLVFLVSLIIFRLFFSYFLSAFGLVPAWIISFVIAASLYLFLVVKVLNLMKF